MGEVPQGDRARQQKHSFGMKHLGRYVIRTRLAPSPEYSVHTCCFNRKLVFVSRLGAQALLRA